MWLKKKELSSFRIAKNSVLQGCGDTIEEAFENIEEAIEVHLDALEEVGELGRVFRERAIEVHQLPLSEPVPRAIPMGKLVKAIQRQIPANPALAV